jgi:hypothetical protein
MLCISLPRPGPRLRAVIVIVIYVLASRLVPGDLAPMAAGSIVILAVAWPASAGDAQPAEGSLR